MNRPPTTVELLQQQQSFRPQTTAGSLKRNARSYPVIEASRNSDAHSPQVIYNDTYPRKRQNSGQRIRSGQENTDGPRTRRTDGYPAPSPNVSAIPTQSRTNGHVANNVPQVATDCSLVFSFVSSLTLVSSSVGASRECGGGVRAKGRHMSLRMAERMPHSTWPLI
jgi:hypothetical protein